MQLSGKRGEFSKPAMVRQVQQETFSNKVFGHARSQVEDKVEEEDVHDCGRLGVSWSHTKKIIQLQEDASAEPLMPIIEM